MYNEILEFARAFGTPIAACVGAYVAYRFGSIQAEIAKTQVGIASRQAETSRDAALTARNKLRMDMYEERLRIYNAVMAMFGDLGVLGHMNSESERKYLQGIVSARWVFGKEMKEFLEGRVWAAMTEYVAAQNNYNDNAETSYRAELAAAKAERRKELLALREEVDQRFAKFMEFERDPLDQLLN